MTKILGNTASENVENSPDAKKEGLESVAAALSFLWEIPGRIIQECQVFKTRMGIRKIVETARQQQASEIFLPSSASWEEISQLQCERERERLVLQLGFPANTSWERIAKYKILCHKFGQAP